MGAGIPKQGVTVHAYNSVTPRIIALKFVAAATANEACRSNSKSNSISNNGNGSFVTDKTTSVCVCERA